MFNETMLEYCTVDMIVAEWSVTWNDVLMCLLWAKLIYWQKWMVQWF